MLPYIPVYERAAVESIRGAAEVRYVRDAAQLLEESMEKDYYCFVRDAEVAVLAVALATACEDEIVEGIVETIKRRVVQRAMVGS